MFNPRVRKDEWVTFFDHECRKEMYPIEWEFYVVPLSLHISQNDLIIPWIYLSKHPLFFMTYSKFLIKKLHIGNLFGFEKISANIIDKMAYRPTIWEFVLLGIFNLTVNFELGRWLWSTIIQGAFGTGYRLRACYVKIIRVLIRMDL